MVSRGAERDWGGTCFCQSLLLLLLLPLLAALPNTTASALLAFSHPSSTAAARPHTHITPPHPPDAGVVGVDDQGPLALHVPPVPHLALAAPQVLGVLRGAHREGGRGREESKQAKSAHMH
jgi:hypothetical protein